MYVCLFLRVARVVTVLVLVVVDGDGGGEVTGASKGRWGRCKCEGRQDGDWPLNDVFWSFWLLCL